MRSATPGDNKDVVMLALRGLTKHYAGKTLFEDVSLNLEGGRRYGLVGANGSGKSTLLRILCGDEEASGGGFTFARHARLGVLRQDQYANDDETIIDTAQLGDREVFLALREKETTEDAVRLAELEDIVVGNDGYALRARAGMVLEGLGIPAAVHDQPLRTLSGGFKLRVLLAQVLVGRPDVLLLDEPTNHLDILSIRWLERFLAGFAGCALVISHDQRFLENTATHILDIDYGTITLYHGGLKAFIADKEAARAQKEAAIENLQQQIDHKRAFVERFGAKATKARQAQSRVKQIDKLSADLEELPDSSRRAPSFHFVCGRPSGREVVELAGISKAYGDKVVLKNIDLRIRRGERVAVIGKNGIGKSTLLKIATGSAVADGGTVKWGHEAVVGTFAQDHREILGDGEDTAISFLTRAFPDLGPTQLRGELGRALFTRDDVQKHVDLLSGGEAARLVFARLALQKPNVLVLDEPTNHLDLESIHALVQALVAYDGTLIFVSHDRWFVSELATRVIEITETGPRDFPGTYADYLASCGDDHLDSDAVLRASNRERAASAPIAQGTDWEEQKRRKNALKAAEKRRGEVMRLLEAKEAELTALRVRFGEPAFWEQTAQPEVLRLQQVETGLARDVDTLMAEWEALEADLTAASDAPNEARN